MRHGLDFSAAVAAVAAMGLLAVGAAMGQAVSPITAPVNSDYPEATVFTTMRILADPVSGMGRADLRDRLKQMQGLAHDHAIRVDGQWLSAEEISQRCQAFIKQHAVLMQKLSEADRLDRRQVPVRAYGPGRAGQAARQRQQEQDMQFRQERERVLQEAREKELAIARLWPDPVIRWFLQGQAALATGNPGNAERLFARCIEALPTVAAFYQGRAMAREAQKRVDGLDDRIAAFNLDTTNAQAYDELRTAFRNAPGKRITAPAFQRAQTLLGEYDAPPRNQQQGNNQRNRAPQIDWLMPGKNWTCDAQAITIPECRSLIARKTVAVPISADEVLCDEAALADASEILLEAAKGQYVRLTVAAVRPADKAAGELPLAVLRTSQCQFKPVELADVSTLKVGQDLTVYAHSLPADLDPNGPRKFSLRVKSLEEGLLVLSAGLRPGETASPVFNVDRRLVTFLAGRADVMADLGGPDRVLPPGQVAELVTAAAKGSHSSPSSFSSRGGVTRKAGPFQVDDSILTLHVIVLQGKP